VGKRLAELNDIEVTIEKLVAGGDGLARFEGIPIFVPRSAPGDRLRVRLVERKGSFGRAEIKEILEPGAGRREPPCPHFAHCGGCDLQHLEDDVQLRLKVETVRENLLRIGHFEVPKDLTVVPGQNWGYRLRAQLHVAPSKERGNQVGYFSRGSHNLVAVESCPVLVPELEKILPQLSRKMRDQSHRRVDLVVGDNKLSVSPTVPDLPRGAVILKVGEFSYTFDAGCFFQSHRQLLPSLVSYAVGELSGVPGDPEGEAFDLYSGVGLFSLPLSRLYRQVTAVEGERTAVRFAKKSARFNKVENLEFCAQSVETWVEKLPERPSRIVVDPPRVGLSKAVREALLKSRPRHLTYVSCNSATLGRDLADLTPAYRATKLVLLDLFPQTGHLEAIVQLVDRAAESS
jgi:23S rRNA (uracil1939-C5)-methyltransferase